MADLPRSFCPLPWLNASIDVDGTIRPCCKFAHQKTNSPYQMGNLKSASLQAVWNSAGMRKLREDFRAGQKPAECATCWTEERAGIPSFRQTFTESWQLDTGDVDFFTDDPDSPRTLDLKVSNVCNLRCRICGPIASSGWMKEELARGQVEPGIADNRDYFLSNKITGDAENRETFRRWIPRLNHVEIFGGEPMLSRENRELEDMMIAEGFAPRIALLFNTNGTVYRPELIQRWKQFRHVVLNLSVDDIGRRFEYQRYPARWAAVSGNVKKFAGLGHPNIRAILFCSVSVFNVWNLPEYLEWAERDCPGIKVVFNLVHNHPSFCILNLPDGLKTGIQRKYSESRFTGDPRLQPVLDFLFSREAEPERWREFWQLTEERDRIRGQRCVDVCPEFASYVPEPARPAVRPPSTLPVSAGSLAARSPAGE